uniref:Uncharacterized 8.5 kDa protein n=2 Tax=Oenothera TaxID=3939 RepID=YCX1_OENBE|nr:RecName: Full=Uncharacterized 8.5 kDa protein; AltName: Full=ORF B72 [Oenothera berteroana]pir/S05485/ hypothetical protein b72 - evening primrose chloroplast [Oenothera villaricae]CAA31336.1 unnamed protein product [Oenothera berteroana]
MCLLYTHFYHLILNTRRVDSSFFVFSFHLYFLNDNKGMSPLCLSLVGSGLHLSVMHLLFHVFLFLFDSFLRP